MHHHLYFSKIFFLVLITIISLLNGCGGTEDDFFGTPKITFIPDGLSGKTTTRFYQHAETVFAGTDKGLYIKSGEYGQWQSAGLSQVEVLDLAILNKDHYLAAIRTATSNPTYQLMETLDAGKTWHNIAHDFGGKNIEGIFSLHYDGDNNALYATGINVLAASFDEGRSWKILDGHWHGFGQPKTVVNRNAATNEIWYGGQNAIEQMALCAYSLDTKEARCFADLIPSPGAIYDIQFDPNHAPRIIVSGDGGIVQSNNHGESWITLINDVNHRSYFNLALDSKNTQTMYTGGMEKEGNTAQPLILEISNNGGKTWTKYRYPSTTIFGGIRSLINVSNGNDTTLYLGLYRGGIMKVNLP
jgi:hypothetical protein